MLVDDAKGTRPQPPSYTFYDFKPEDIDARLADDAPHRPIDLALKRKLMSPEKEKEHNARAQIVLPCLIYGLGSGPFNNISIQAPALMRASITAGHGVV